MRLKRKVGKIKMGRKSALIDNKYTEGSKEFDYFYKKMVETQSALHELKYNNVTNSRYFKITGLLKEFKENNFKFTIGSVDYVELNDFIIASYMIMSDEFIRESIREFLKSEEINPIYYGYKSINLQSLTQKILDINQLNIKELK